jgi:hypothetical protein
VIIGDKLRCEICKRLCFGIVYGAVDSEGNWYAACDLNHLGELEAAIKEQED